MRLIYGCRRGVREGGGQRRIITYLFSYLVFNNLIYKKNVTSGISVSVERGDNVDPKSRLTSKSNLAGEISCSSSILSSSLSVRIMVCVSLLSPANHVPNMKERMMAFGGLTKGYWSEIEY